MILARTYLIYYVMKKSANRGVPIGSYTSQPLGNLAVSYIDHYLKERLKVKCYLRYCDDAVGLAKDKKEARRCLREFNALSCELGLCVKANAICAPIRTLRAGRKRKRQRGKRKKD